MTQPEPIEVAPPVHEHRPVKVLGIIVCAHPHCRLRVERPAGMPDYTRAVMSRW